MFRTSGRRLVEAGWKAVYGEEVERASRPRTTPAATSCCRSSSRARAWTTLEVESMRKETQPPRRFTEASLLGAMETAGKEVEDAELREAMKDSGIGTPGHARVDHRAAGLASATSSARAARCIATEKGDPGDPPARRAPAHLARADRRLGAAPRPDRAGRGHAAGVHEGHRQVHDRDGRRSSTSSRA